RRSDVPLRPGSRIAPADIQRQTSVDGEKAKRSCEGDIGNSGFDTVSESVSRRSQYQETLSQNCQNPFQEPFQTPPKQEFAGVQRPTGGIRQENLRNFFNAGNSIR